MNWNYSQWIDSRHPQRGAMTRLALNSRHRTISRRRRENPMYHCKRWWLINQLCRTNFHLPFVRSFVPTFVCLAKYEEMISSYTITQLSRSACVYGKPETKLRETSSSLLISPLSCIISSDEENVDLFHIIETNETAIRPTEERRWEHTYSKARERDSRNSNGLTEHEKRRRQRERERDVAQCS